MAAARAGAATAPTSREGRDRDGRDPRPAGTAHALSVTFRVTAAPEAGLIVIVTFSFFVFFSSALPGSSARG